MTYNGINFSKTGTYGGTMQVFYSPAHNRLLEVVNGAIMDKDYAPALYEKAFAGDFGYYNHSTGKFQLLKTFKLHTAIDDTSTKMVFYQTEFDHVLHEGDVICIAPATASTTGIAITVGAVTLSTVKGVQVGTIDITAKTWGESVEIPAGTIFVIGAEAGSGKLPKLTTINAILGSDVDITIPLKSSNFQSGYGDITCYPYYHGVLIKESIKLPKYVELLNKLPNTDYFEL